MGFALSEDKMGLSASMWTGVSGLLAHGERMSVVGNNIANVNTLGFKGQRMDFQDFIYQDSYSAGGTTQIGRGVTIGAVMGDFSQGVFEQTTEVTDLAIGGRGFFKVKPQGSESEYYTRAGNFRFQNDGSLTNPAGYVLQGWKMDNTQGPTRATGQQANAAVTAQVRGSGLPTDVRLDTWSVEPLQTTKVGFAVDLHGAKNGDNSVNLENPFASLLTTWNGKQPPAPNSPSLAEEAYAYSVPIKVYDEAGGVHTLTMYLDKVGKDTYNSADSDGDTYEYILTMDPAEDLRRVAIPNPDYKPGGVGKPGDAQPASSVFETSTATPPVWTLKGGYNLDPKYSFNSGAAPLIPLDATKPETWPADVFAVAPATWPLQDAAGNRDEPTIVDMKNTKQAGILMSGTISFNSAGYMSNMSSYVVNGNRKPVESANGGFQDGNGFYIDPINGTPVPLMDPDNPADYMYPTEVSSNGYPLIVPNFTGVQGADAVGSVPDADRYLMEVNFGMKVSNYKNPWQNNESLGSLHPTVLKNNLYDIQNPLRGPAQYTADNRVSNPNYQAGAPNSNGPEYIYQNPAWKDSDNKVTYVAGTPADPSTTPPTPAVPDSWTIVLDSPKYNYGSALSVGDMKTYTFTSDDIPVPPNVSTNADYNALMALQAKGVLSFNPAKAGGKGAITWGTKAALGADLADPRVIANMTEPTLKEQNAFTNNGSSNFTRSTTQNGYGRGELSSWTVNAEGILSGIYSNGVTLPLYQLAMYDFTCKQGLRREGGNLFSETMESGAPSTGVAGSNGLGTINAQNLEGSNVDLSREFVNMITTQRGFQSNSKIVTTVDTMLEVVVNMKR